MIIENDVFLTGFYCFIFFVLGYYISKKIYEKEVQE